MGNESFMKVLFDGTCITENPAGIGNYAYQLLKEFARDNQHEVGVLCLDPRYVPQGEKITPIKVYSKYGKFLPFDVLKKFGKYDVYHQPDYIPHKFHGKTVITVHDMSHKVYPEYHPWKRVAVRNIFEKRMKNADVIMTVSESSKREIEKYWKVLPEKIHVTYLGTDDKYDDYSFCSKDNYELANNWNIPDNYILFVGTIEPRKNLQRLIKAFDMYKSLANNNLKLVLAGDKGWLSEDIYNEASKARCSKDIIFTGYFPEHLKPALYAKAKALVYPSLYEGFGLPILEALTMGIPVLTSNISSMPEITGDIGIYVDPISIESIENGIKNITECDVDKYRLKGVAMKFKWVNCYKKTIECFELI